MVCSSKRRLSQEPIRDKKNSLSLSLSSCLRSHYTTVTSCSFLFSLQQFLCCQSCLLLIMLFIPSLPPLEREVFDMRLFSPPVFFFFLCVSSSRGRVVPREWPSGPLIQRVLCKAMCSITVVVCPNNTSNEQQIHSCKISVIFTSLAHFVFPLL